MRPMQRPAAGGGAFCPRSRPATADRSLIQPSGAARLAVAARRLCGGQILATLPVGRSVSRRRATTRSHPLADPLLPSGGPIRPASYGRLSYACGAIRFGSARQSAPPLALFASGSADPLRQVWLTTRCAGDPLAAAGPIFGTTSDEFRRLPGSHGSHNQRVEPFAVPINAGTQPNRTGQVLEAETAHQRHQATLAPGALPPRPEAPPVPQVITATRSPRLGRWPFGSPPSDQRRRSSPPRGPWLPATRSPPAPRRCG